MSTSSTVDVRVSISVRWTSKSEGARRTRRSPVAARAAGAFSSRPSALNERPAQIQVERVAELVRLRRLLALPSPTRPADPVTAERVPLQPGEQVVEHLLADLPAAPRSQLQPLPVPGQVSRLLEPPGEIVQRVQFAARVLAQQIADLLAVDRGEIPRRPDVGQGVLEPIERLQPRDLGQRTFEPERLVAAERHPIAQAAGQKQVEVRGQLGEVEQQSVVAEERLHHRLELGALLGAHRAHQRLHRSHPLRELVDDVVERLGAREEPAVLLEELGGIRVADHRSARGSAR